MSGPIGPGPAADGFQIDLDGLAAHAAAVDALAERIGTAAGKALPVPQAAYGFIGQLFAADATNAANVATLAVGRLAESNRGAAAELNASYNAYAAAERDNVGQFTRVPR